MIFSCIITEYVQHEIRVVIYLHTNYQVFSPTLLKTLATTRKAGSVHSARQFARSHRDAYKTILILA